MAWIYGSQLVSVPIQIRLSIVESAADEPAEVEIIDISAESFVSELTEEFHDDSQQIVEAEPVQDHNISFSVDTQQENQIISTKAVSLKDLLGTYASHTAEEDEETEPLDTNTEASTIVQQLANNIGTQSTSSGNKESQQNFMKEMDRRLGNAGAKTGDVQISLSWNTIDDIDLHVYFTSGNGLVEEINWIKRRGHLTGGMLDIDMNANERAVSTQPVENIFWAKDSSPNGFFTVYVHFFRSWSGAKQIPVVVRIKNGKNIEFFQVMAQLYASPQKVKHFSYPANRKTSF